MDVLNGAPVLRDDQEVTILGLGEGVDKRLVAGVYGEMVAF